ncbi:Aste57867_21542 [Aphanomyces stellatus]|uniref:Aste57867_21542 protein n=1 Tax=Aphanomyces stellatus TaxID=120398 RepID=A0A485LJ27_9STRA|nr:hypothetical protein As57867_021473 [Aphanomyces stellatus]VFT98212.1 Aste57867_21542 [Aphanomyces stellatus]
MAREFDIVVFGASGFTGQYVALYLAKRALELKKPLKWAIAGRSRKKLEDTREWVMRQEPSYKGDDIPIIVADAFDAPSLEAMCSSTAILLTCAGPFLYFGEPVVKACIAAHTHYLDITGEVQFVLETMVKYNAAAQANDCVVVSCVGYDSLPTELSALFAAAQFPSDGCMTSAEVFMGMDSKGGHATTYECVVLMADPAHAVATSRLRRQLPSPSPSAFAGPRLAKSWFGYDARLGKPYFRFTGADPLLLELSQATATTTPAVQTVVYFAIDFVFVLPLVFFGLILATLGRFEWGRQLMIKYPAVFTAGSMTHQGPTPSQLKAASFTTHCFAQGYQDKTKLQDSPDWHVHVRLDGPEPGYVATPILMVESALCVWRGEVKARGVVSPGVAFRGTTIIDSLNTQGIAFTAVKSGAVA